MARTIAVLSEENNLETGSFSQELSEVLVSFTAEQATAVGYTAELKRTDVAKVVKHNLEFLLDIFFGRVTGTTGSFHGIEGVVTHTLTLMEPFSNLAQFVRGNLVVSQTQVGKLMFLKERLKLNNLACLEVQARQVEYLKGSKLWLNQSRKHIWFHNSCLGKEFGHISPKFLQGVSMNPADSHNSFTQFLFDIIKGFIIVVVFILNSIQGTTKAIADVLDTTLTLRPCLEASVLFVLHKINIFLEFKLLDSASIKQLDDKVTWSSAIIITCIDLQEVEINNSISRLSDLIHHLFPDLIVSFRIFGSHTLLFIGVVKFQLLKLAAVLVQVIEEVLHGIKVIVFHVDSQLLHIGKFHEPVINLIDP